MNLLSRHPVQTLLLSIISVLSLISKPDRALSVPLQSFYPFDRQDFQLPGNEDDISSSTITLSVPVKFFGYTYSYIYVNGNGLLSFLAPLPYFLSTPFPLDYPVIAPFYANVDTTRIGNVFYKETDDVLLLTKATADVQRYFPSAAGWFQATSLFTSTWSKVGYYPARRDKINTFQVAIISNETDSYVQFLYADDGIQWLQSSAEGSPDAKAQAGFVSADGRIYKLKGSGADQIRNLNKWSNTDTPGLWMFRVGNIKTEQNIEPPQFSSSHAAEITDKRCLTAYTFCHSQATCNDFPDGFCCACKNNYYGNGYNCLAKDNPLRANGRANVTVNGIGLSNLNLQTYIAVSDGRTYWALSKVPPNVGQQFQLLYPLVTVLGWLFAKQVNNGLNGYQITGGELNYAAHLSYPETGDRITVVQRVLGLDIYDQLSVEINIKGTLPKVPDEVKISAEDYQYQFTRSGPGSFTSVSSLAYRINGDPRNRTISLQQTVTYSESCLYQLAANNSFSVFRVKAARNFLDYEEKENILRFASTNKVSVWSETEDPCVQGRAKCVVNSSCFPEAETFKCVCNPGFKSINPESQPIIDGEGGCVDVNECVEGIYTCDGNALCVNEVGTYSCQCKPGFTGNGYYCSEIESPCVKNPELCIPAHSQCDDYANPDTCKCKDGFRKVYVKEKEFACEDIDECSFASVCHQNATCTNVEGSYTCECKPEFTGDGVQQCAPIVDPCEKLACPQGAECVKDPYGIARCRCQPGYVLENDHCTSVTATPIVISLPCDIAKDCSLNGECIFNETTHEYACLCIRGYSGDGYTCTIVTPEKKTIPKTCILGTCWCPTGYTEVDGLCAETEIKQPPIIPEGVPCNDVNICNTHAQCLRNATTRTYYCQCNPGYEGDGFECLEIVETSCLKLNNCDRFAKCQQDESTGHGSCVCNYGYQGDGISCIYTGECTSDSDCRENEECMFDERTEGYNCRCIRDFVKDSNGACVQRKKCPKCHQFAECIESQTIAFDPYCRCKAEYTGDGVNQCTLIPPTCNIVNNCSPFAECVYDHQALPKPTYYCQCKKGYDGDGFYCINTKTCAEVPELCHRNASCVVDRRKTFQPQCVCNNGHIGNGTYCVEIPRQEGNFLLVNHGLATIRLPVQPTPSNPGYPIHLHARQSAIGLAIDCVDGRVYWSDYVNRVIRSSNYKGKDVRDIVNKNMSSPEGVTIDWINRVLYWTDSGKHTIESINLDGTERKLVISKGLIEPRGLTVHPHIRKIFWSDWNRIEPKIEWSDLDGSRRSVLVQSPKIQLPNSVDIDWNRNELCWADAGTKTIDCLEIDTQISRTVVTNCTYPFGLAVTSDRYYWTDWITGKIGSADKRGTKLESLPVPLPSIDKLHGIVYVPPRCP